MAADSDGADSGYIVDTCHLQGLKLTKAGGLWQPRNSITGGLGLLYSTCVLAFSFFKNHFNI